MSRVWNELKNVFSGALNTHKSMYIKKNARKIKRKKTRWVYQRRGRSAQPKDAAMKNINETDITRSSYVQQRSSPDWWRLQIIIVANKKWFMYALECFFFFNHTRQSQNTEFKTNLNPWQIWKWMFLKLWNKVRRQLIVNVC